MRVARMLTDGNSPTFQRWIAVRRTRRFVRPPHVVDRTRALLENARTFFRPEIGVPAQPLDQYDPVAGVAMNLIMKP